MLGKRDGNKKVDEELRIYVKALRDQSPCLNLANSHDNVSSWIQGTLTTSPTTIKEEHWLGYVYVEDPTGAIPCEFCDWRRGAECLGQQVTCRRWQYVRGRGPPGDYLEVAEWESRGSNHSATSPGGCVNVTTAAVLLNNKDKLKTKSINVRGKVSYLSEIIRVKGDPLFLVQVQDGSSAVNILVKTPPYLHWQRLMEPQEEFIITGLRPTTLYKGTDQETRLYVPGSLSRLLHTYEDTETEILSLQDWLSHHNEQDLDVASGTPVVPTSTDSSQHKLISYKGTVTKIEDAQNGIYELDGKVRLFLTYVHAVHKFAQLRPGAEVVVYNSHHIAASQKTLLCSCLVSCIKVKGFSSNTTSKRFEHQASHVVHMANQHGLSIHKLDWVLSLQRDLQRRLYPQYLRSKDVSAVLHKMLTKSGGSLTHGCARSMLTEFLRPNHAGCYVIPKEDTKEAQFILPSIHDVKSRGKVLATDLAKLKSQLELVTESSHSPDDTTYWSYDMLEPKDLERPWVVVGVLMTDNTTGHIQLVDRTGKIDCTVANWDISTAAKCHCCKIDDKIPGICQCLDLLPCHLGRVVRIDRWRLVVERFIPNDMPTTVGEDTDENLKSRLQVRIYLQFSVADTVFLTSPLDPLVRSHREEANCQRPGEYHQKGTSSRRNDISDVAPTAKRLRADEKGIRKFENQLDCDQGVVHAGKDAQDHIATKDKNVNVISQLMIVTQKDSLHVRSRQSHQPGLCFYARACLLNTPSTQSPSTVQSTSSKHPDATSKPRNLPNPDKDRDHQNLHSATGSSDSSCERLPVRHVALCFGPAVVNWYHLLTPGQAYRLVSRKPLTPPSAGRPSLQRALNKTDVCQCVPITDDTGIVAVTRNTEGTTLPLQRMSDDENLLCERVRKLLQTSGKIPAFLSVQQVIDLELEGVVHVQGIIVSRHFTRSQHQRAPHLLAAEQETNTRLGVSVPGGLHLCLTLADIDRPSVRLKLYLDPSHLSYPLGLLDGAIINVSRAQLRRSRRSAPYCQLLVASALCVTSLQGGATVLANLGHGPALGEGDARSSNLGPLPLTRLADLCWRKNEEGAEGFRCVVHVHKVLTLRLWSNCVTCGNMHRQGTCTYMACRSTVSPKVKVKVSAVVDDGTTTGFMSCSGDDSVRSLLDLDATQWRTFKLQAEEVGEVAFTQKGGSQTSSGLTVDMELLLSALCESCLVKRQVTVWVKVSCPPAPNTGRYPRPTAVTNAARHAAPQLSCLRLEQTPATELLTELLSDLLTADL